MDSAALNNGTMPATLIMRVGECLELVTTHKWNGTERLEQIGNCLRERTWNAARPANTAAWEGRSTIEIVFFCECLV